MPIKRALSGLFGLLLGVQHRIQSPVLDGLECTDLTFALDDQAHGDGLHTSSGESSADLIPEQRRNLIADQAVENAAGLLRVNQILVQLAGVLEGLLHRLLGDLVESYAANLFSFLGVGAQLEREVVGNGLALAVRVRRQKDLVGFGGGPLELRDDLLLARRDDQRRLEGAILQLYANIVLGQVHDVAHRGQHLEAFAQIFLNRLCLGGRLDDNQ